jgi:hypothetical protein
MYIHICDRAMSQLLLGRAPLMGIEEWRECILNAVGWDHLAKALK